MALPIDPIENDPRRHIVERETIARNFVAFADRVIYSIAPEEDMSFEFETLTEQLGYEHPSPTWIDRAGIHTFTPGGMRYYPEKSVRALTGVVADAPVLSEDDKFDLLSRLVHVANSPLHPESRNPAFGKRHAQGMVISTLKSRAMSMETMHFISPFEAQRMSALARRAKRAWNYSSDGERGAKIAALAVGVGLAAYIAK